MYCFFSYANKFWRNYFSSTVYFRNSDKERATKNHNILSGFMNENCRYGFFLKEDYCTSYSLTRIKARLEKRIELVGGWEWGVGGGGG
jgi:hypothetical protein